MQIVVHVYNIPVLSPLEGGLLGGVDMRYQVYIFQK